MTISGTDYNRIYDAKDYLLNLEEEYIQDVTDNEYMQQYTAPSQNRGSSESKNEKQSNGFVVKGAPWEHAPDTQVTIPASVFCFVTHYVTLKLTVVM